MLDWETIKVEEGGNIHDVKMASGPGFASRPISYYLFMDYYYF
jgi:hypothetical protein